MEIIAHRINKVEDLRPLGTDVGIEIDLRANGDKTEDIYCQHEPFDGGELFENILAEYQKKNMTGTVILDIKNERIELKCIELLKKYGVKNYFFLDCSFPMIYKLTSMNEKNVAVRFSEYEGLDTVVSMARKCKWVWVDTFTKNPLTKEIADKIHFLGYKICFVSPELQGQPELKEQYMNMVKDYVDAICTDIE